MFNCLCKRPVCVSLSASCHNANAPFTNYKPEQIIPICKVHLSNLTGIITGKNRMYLYFHVNILCINQKKINKYIVEYISTLFCTQETFIYS